MYIVLHLQHCGVNFYKISTFFQQVTFDNVKLKDLPGGAFPSALSTLTLRNSNISHVSAKAISLIMMQMFTIDSCRVDKWGSGTFQNTSVINQLYIINSRLKVIETDAFNPGAGSLLSIRHSV